MRKPFSFKQKLNRNGSDLRKIYSELLRKPLQLDEAVPWREFDTDTSFDSPPPHLRLPAETLNREDSPQLDRILSLALQWRCCTFFNTRAYRRDLRTSTTYLHANTQSLTASSVPTTRTGMGCRVYGHAKGVKWWHNVRVVAPYRRDTQPPPPTRRSYIVSVFLFSVRRRVYAIFVLFSTFLLTFSHNCASHFAARRHTFDVFCDFNRYTSHKTHSV